MLAPYVLSTLLQRGALGAAAALPVALLARRADSLSTSGAVAAVVVGAASVAAGWAWGALLIVYFVAGSALSHFRRADKERLTGAVVAKGGARDATQVLANGGIFAASAFLAPFGPSHFGVTMSIGALGALAAASADTWSTEIGTLFGGVPRSLVSFRRVPAGTSGGVSIAGSLAMACGAALIAVTAALLGLPRVITIVIMAGIAGAVADSLLGACVQERRWCAACERGSERRMHDCGTATVLLDGHEWVDNDVVNLLATVTGAAVAGVLAVF
ncbi:MAG: protein of unknown function transrane [Gemmatimonadetes bacterium]|nr:protein of unknown function transrane [Gemmatimonadota bacterium]